MPTDADTTSRHVTSPGDNERPPPPLDPDTLRRRRRRNRIPLLIVLVLTLLGVGTAIYDAFAPTTEEPLDAHSHAVVAQACDTTYRTLKALPPLTHDTTRVQLEARVLQENTIFAAMTAKFDRLQPPNHDGRIALRAWTADWRTVLARRADYVQRLKATRARVDFVIPIDTAGAPVTDRMNQYSRTHSLNQCLTENLQLETVDTIRQYPKSDTVSDV